MANTLSTPDTTKNTTLQSTKLEFHDSWVKKVRERFLTDKKNGVLYWRVLTGKETLPTLLSDASNKSEVERWQTANDIAAALTIQMLDKNLQIRTRTLENSDGDVDAFKLWMLIKSWVDEKKYYFERQFATKLESLKMKGNNADSVVAVDSYIIYVDEIYRRFALYGGQMSQSRLLELFLWGLDEKSWGNFRRSCLENLIVISYQTELTSNLFTRDNTKYLV